MSVGRLSAIQARALVALVAIRPTWTLTGGAALAAVYTKHRATRDLDLFWHGHDALDRQRTDVIDALRAAGLDVQAVQTSRTFAQLRAADGSETLIVDLVADPVPVVEAPHVVLIAGVSMQVDTAHEILVNKLCALLSRSEVRDLDDVEALISAGGDLSRALRDAPSKDAGFSPLTLAWLLRSFPLETLASSSGVTTERTTVLATFRDSLVDRVLRLAAP